MKSTAPRRHGDTPGAHSRALTEAAAEGSATASAGLLRWLVGQGLDDLPMPGHGRTLARWQALCDVAAHDLSLAKLFEGHTDALAILRELGAGTPPPGSLWGTWAAEPPQARVVFADSGAASVTLNGRKAWCSGADHVSHGLLTVWQADGQGPWLASVAMDQPGVRVDHTAWQSVGMAGSAAVDVFFDGAQATLVGQRGDYLSRPGFWQGGAGIAACWYGGAVGIAQALHRAVAGKPADPFRLAALGEVDLALRQTATLLRESADLIDRHPAQDASAITLRVRLSAEATAGTVLTEAGRVLGAAPFCLDARFARLAADLPVFVRQSHAARDFMALGERVAAEASPWRL